MGEINVMDIAKEIMNSQKELNEEEIAKYVDENLNGKSIKQEEIGNVIMTMVSQLIGITRTQDTDFTVTLLQRIVDELQKQKN